MANYPDYDPLPGEARWLKAGEAAVSAVVTTVAEALICCKNVELLPHPAIYERAEALRGLLNALTEAQEPIDAVLADGFVMVAEMERVAGE